MRYAIETQSLIKQYRRTLAVDGLDLKVPTGACFALLGPNGAGKTTTIQMLMNLIRPTSGTAMILAKDSQKLGVHDFEQIGYVSENQQQPDWMTVGQLLKHCAPMYPSWDADFCAQLMKQFDLPFDQKIGKLSRGMRMKAALISSIAYRPKLLVLDEPFSGLDPLVRDEFIEGILEVTDEEGWTILVSSHDIDEIEHLTDQVGILNAGKLAVSESVEGLLERFRRVEVIGGTVPDNPPGKWLRVEQSGKLTRFVIDDFSGSPEATVAEVISRFGSGIQVEILPMRLREIFVELAKKFRIREDSVATPLTTKLETKEVTV